MAAQADQSGTAALTARDRIDVAALTRWLEANVAGFHGRAEVAKFAGGQSNPTFRIDAASGRYVLRRKPLGPTLPSAHAVDREFRVISALHPTGFPVARPYALCTDDAVIGSMFYVMELVDGRNLWDGRLPEQSPDERAGMYRSMIETLGELHNQDYIALGLEDFGRPGNYFGRQVDRWTRQYRAAQTDDIPEVEKLIDYLPRTLPPQTRSSIIHGDYRLDNLMFARAEPRVSAVLDWELSTIGDPLADFAYLAMNWVTESANRAAIKGVDLAGTGIPTLDEATAIYCATTNRDGVPELDWYFSYSLFRLAGIVQGIKKRFLDGSASSAAAEEAGSRVPQLAAAAWEFARRAGARD